MTIQDFIDSIEADTLYVNHSLILKSSDDYGCVYKWLVKCLISGVEQGVRKEIFLELDPVETGELLAKTVVNSIEVLPAE